MSTAAVETKSRVLASGDFIWYELMTSGVERATEFYCGASAPSAR